MKNVGIAVALFCCATSVTIVSSHAASAIPDAVQRAAAFNAASMNGVLVEERHVQFNASAGPAHFSQENDAIVMLEDGQYKHLRYLRVIENGKTLAPEQVAEKESQNNADLAQGKTFFKQPYDGRYLHDYTFSEAPCETCTGHERAIAFKSDTRDDQHGDGTMVIDAATGRVTSLTYAPNVLPARASAATVNEIYGQTSTGLWTIVEIDHEYSGHVAFIRGSGKMIEKLDHFQRFTTSYAGMQYLQRASL